MTSVLRRAGAAGLTAVLVAAGFAGSGILPRAAATTQAATGPSVDWPKFGNTSDNTRFSTLTQVNDTNVGKLGVAWTHDQGQKLSTLETDPVVVNGIMYLTTNLDQVRALDAATGKLLWQYTPKVDFYHAIAGGGGGVPTNRGVTIANGKVYLLTFDDQLIALQASTGEKLWKSQVADPTQGYSETSPATYWNGMLFVGSAESDAGLRGFVAAYDATTGKQDWRFYTVPAAGEGWMPKVGQHGGGDVWMPSVIDEKTGILYFGTGNPSPDVDNRQRPGCNPWVNATMAVNARTGKMVWAHTEYCNDQWDYDSHQPPMLFDVTINGKTIPAVGHGNKSGIYFVYDRATGKVLAQSPFIGKQTIPRPKPTAKGVLVCPGATGGFEYSPPAFSPTTHLAYEPGLNTCAIYKLGVASETALHKRGAPDFGGVFIPSGKATGFMVGINTVTGKVAWKTDVPVAMIGGAVATAGNLVFSGSDDGNFYAFNATNGKILWKAHLGLGFGAAPITYAVHGTQYVAIASGGSAVSALTGAQTGGTLVVFKLNGAPIHALKPITSGALPEQKITTTGLKQINPWMWVDAANQRVVIKIVAAATSDNSGFNFDGYSKGKANFIVPAGWQVDWIFSNLAELPHSAAIAAGITPPVDEPMFGQGPAATANATKGISAGTTQYVSFGATHTGKNYLVCLVPGHIQAGMWDYFTVSTTATAPSLEIAK